MKQIKNQNFFEWNKNILVDAVKKIGLNIILIVILDAVFYMLSGYIIILWKMRIDAKIAAFNFPSNIFSQSAERIQEVLAGTKNIFYLIVVSLVLVLIAVIFLASIIKCIIWAKTTNTKITLNLISKFLALNLIWMGFWLALSVLLFFLIKKEMVFSFMIVIIILELYFTNTLYTIFMQKQEIGTINYVVKLKVKKTKISSAQDLLVATRFATVDFLNTLKQVQIFTSIRDTIKLNIVKIHLFLLPYAVIFILLFAIAILNGFIKFKYGGILSSSIILFYIAVIRYYISTLVLKIEESK